MNLFSIIPQIFYSNKKCHIQQKHSIPKKTKIKIVQSFFSSFSQFSWRIWKDKVHISYIQYRIDLLFKRKTSKNKNKGKRDFHWRIKNFSFIKLFSLCDKNMGKFSFITKRWIEEEIIWVLFSDLLYLGFKIHWVLWNVYIFYNFYKKCFNI